MDVPRGTIEQFWCDTYLAYLTAGNDQKVCAKMAAKAMRDYPFDKVGVRDRLAEKAMHGILSSWPAEATIDSAKVAQLAYNIADAMLLVEDR